jgi:hypothetical protein
VRNALKAILGTAAALALVAPAAATAQVTVYPTPGTKYNRPATQVSFRGIPPSPLGTVTVVGSKTGAHPGRIAADSDGQGASFLPFKPFKSGETVTVATHLSVLGGNHGRFSFKIAHAIGLLGYGALPLAPAVPGGVQHFRSDRALEPAAVKVDEDRAPASQGDIFVAPQNGPVQTGPMILDPHGRLVWFSPHPVRNNTLISDFRVQTLSGQPVLTWWEGNSRNGLGRGEGVIMNRNYQQIGTVRAGNGLDMDLHEFLLTPQGTAYIIAAAPVQVPGVKNPTIDEVVQEIDIQTGLVLFEWHALDHIRLSESYFSARPEIYTFDPFHLNSVGLDHDGNLIVSARNTSTVYKIDHSTGRVIWRFGGKRPTFKMGAGTPTWGQHDALVLPDGTITMFDDGAGPPTVHPYSRGIRVSVDLRSVTARLLTVYRHSPQISANFEGGVQPLSGGDVFLGWGQQPYFSEDDASGRQVFDAHFAEPTTSYRAYRFRWSGQPTTQPALVSSLQPTGAVSLYTSWNGATDVASWRVLAGSSPKTLTATGQSTRNGFETHLSAHSPGPYFEVQPLGASGKPLSSSAVRTVPPHLGISGSSAFVSSGGTGGIPVGCYAPRPCTVTATVSSGRSSIGASGRVLIDPGGGAIVHFKLSPAGKEMLGGASGNRLAVTIRARASSVAGASAAVSLARFGTSGPGPSRSATPSATLRIVGGTEFVSSRGIGGILAACAADAPCPTTATVSAGGATIARTHTEYVDAHGLGYVIFDLNKAGITMLGRARGNQLAATVTLSGPGGVASATVALVRFT